MYEYQNTFHNTTYTSRKSPEDLERIAERLACGTATDAEKTFARRMKNALCGVSGCTCSDEFGRRN